MDSDQRSRYTGANRRAWNEAAPVHARHNQSALLAAVSGPDFCNLDEHVRGQLERIGIEERAVAQLCCNNGIDLLSARKLGAGHCVGFDAAEAFVEQARELARAAGEPDVEHVVADVYHLPERYDGCFDVVLVTVGVLLWMPDLAGFFAAARRLLRPGGHLLLEDIHPVLPMYEESEPGELPRPVWSYFHRSAWREDTGLDYFTGRAYDSEPNYSFQHTLADVLMGALGQDLELRHIRELDRDIACTHAELERARATPPMGMVVLWRAPTSTSPSDGGS